MSPKKKPKPRPVTAWFYADERIYIADPSSHRKSPQRIRCRITPIRKPTDAEVERLARKLASAVFLPAWENLSPNDQELAREFAKVGWWKGARP